MLLAILTFIMGLAISAVAIYYSVIGLAAIFAAAVVPIMVMGAILEVGKLVAAWWLKWNWHRAPFLLKSYMLLAVVVLMLITSMGIFGFLSKAHTEQAVPVGDNLARIEIIDERIAIQQEVIAQARQDIAILDQQIERFTELGAVTRGVNVRNDQRLEREALTNQISLAQDAISELRLERAPFAASLRAIEAEVGPIKYIAKLIYGDNPDQNLLEKAVVWVIIVIVFVFDPLAVLLLLASQLSFQWARQDKLAQQALIAEVPRVKPEPDPVKEERQEPKLEEPLEESVEEIELPAKQEEEAKEEPLASTTSAIELSDKEIVEALNEVYTEDLVTPVDEEQIERLTDLLKDVDVEDDEDVPEHIKIAKKAWKIDNPNDSLKHQRKMLEMGMIKELPWMLPPYNLEAVDDDALQAARWAQEQLEKVSWMENEGGQQVKKEGYVQNQEQSDSTLWKKVKDSKGE